MSRLDQLLESNQFQPAAINHIQFQREYGFDSVFDFVKRNRVYTQREFTWNYSLYNLEKESNLRTSKK